MTDPKSTRQHTELSLLSPKVLFPFLLVSLIWGSTWLVIRDQLGTVPQSWSITYRFALAALAMFILARAMRLPLRLDTMGQRWAVLVGLLQFGINFHFVYAVEHYITSGLVAVLFAMLIVPNAIFGKIWLGRSVGYRFWVGVTIASVGVFLLMLREYQAAAMAPEAVLLGVVLTLTAVMTASISNVLQASKRLSRFPIITTLAWCMLYGALANGLWALAYDGLPSVEMRAGYFLGLAYLAIVGTVVAFPFYFALIRDIGPAKAAYTSVLIPVIAMLLSTVFEGYNWSTLAITGAVLAMVGLVVSMQARSPS